MITILTPTYNRAYILKDALHSLCNQSDNRFEWIVVDDGSTDDTENLVQSWLLKPLPFDLRYIRQPNGGKHRAVNKGVCVAKYDHVLILDSDDFLTEDAVEKIHSWIQSIDGEEDFAGVAGLRGWKNRTGCIGGAGTGADYVDATNTERRKYHLDGDKAEVYKTEILKRYPFPEFEGEKFLPEHIVWDRIAKDGYKLRWYRDVIYVGEYLEDGLTKSTSYKLPINNFQGFTLSTTICKELHGFPWNYFSIGLYDHVAKIKGIRTSEIKERIQVNSFQLLLGRAIFKMNELRKKLKKDEI